jgi:hypothetical protein
MKIWFDTEFIEDGKTIDLISIGLIREDGHTLYFENIEADLSKGVAWVQDNVIRKLDWEASHGHTRKQIADQVREFAGDRPEFWAWYGAYDWVALCQLYGTMMQLPKGWPMYCRDLKQLCDMVGNPTLPSQPEEERHHALKDAIWTRDAHRYLADTWAPAMARILGDGGIVR